MAVAVAVADDAHFAYRLRPSRTLGGEGLPGQYMNAGPARLPQSHVTLEYRGELDVPVEVFTNQNANAYIYHDKSAALAGKAIRWRTAKADVYGYVSELLAKATD